MNAVNQVKDVAAKPAAMNVIRPGTMGAGKSVTMIVLEQATVGAGKSMFNQTVRDAENLDCLIEAEYKTESDKDNQLARTKAYCTALNKDGRKGGEIHEGI